MIENLEDAMDDFDPEDYDSADLTTLRAAFDDFKTDVWGNGDTFTIALTASTSDGGIIYEFDFDDILDILLDYLESDL